MAPTATRAAVSRALARSSTLRMSSSPYFTKPARSAWPGRGRVTGGRSAPDASAGISGSDVHRALPVLPVLVGNEQRDRRAGRHAVADAAQRLGAIGLDGHPAPASVAGLAPAEFGGHGIEIDGETGRQCLRGSATSALPCDSPAVRNRSMRLHSIRKKCALRPPPRRDSIATMHGPPSCTTVPRHRWQEGAVHLDCGSIRVGRGRPGDRPGNRWRA